VRERLVKDGLKYLDNLSKDTANDPSLLRELAGAYEKVAAVQGGIAMSGRGTILAASNLGDTKGAVEIMKLNTLAYPDSPNSYDSLSDAYLADGQKDLALQNAKRALELLAKELF